MDTKHIELSKTSRQTEQFENVPGLMTEIFRISPVTGTKLRVLPELMLFMELRDENGDLLPGDSELLFTASTPTSDKPMVISNKISSIYDYRRFTIREQQSRDYRSNFGVRLPESVAIEDDEHIDIELQSTEVVDWDNSLLFLAENGVEEFDA